MQEPQEPDPRLHPALVERVMRIQSAGGKPPHLQTPAEVRAAFLSARQPLQRKARGLVVQDIALDGSRGKVAARTYVPADRPVRAAVAYFHGGGFTNGDLDSHDAVACALALGSGCAVLSVDYAVLPDHPFPAAFEDAVVAIRWLPRWAEQLGLQRGDVAAGGDSSGANLAMAAALEIVADQPLKALWLAYPIIGADFDTPSYRLNAHAPLLTAARCRRILADYLGRPLSAQDWRVTPLISSDLARLPPTVAIAAELDPLRSDAEILVERLGHARGRLIRGDGLPHGFLRWIDDCEPCTAVATESFAAFGALLATPIATESVA